MFLSLLVALILLVSAPLGVVDAAIQTVYITPMSHLDIGFTATQQQVAELQKPILDEVIFFGQRLDDFCWTIEQFWQLEQWLEATDHPELVDDLLALVHNGQIEVGGSYGSMHSGFMAGEFATRMLCPSLRFAEEHGVSIDTVVQNDVPGYSRDLPSVLAGAGIKYFVTGINTSLGVGGFDLPIDHNPFYWRGPDGKQVLTWVSRDSYMEGYSLNTVKLRNILERLEQDGYPHEAVLLLCAADNCDSTIAIGTLLNVVRQWNEHRLDHEPIIVLSTPTAFFQHMEKQGQGKFPVYEGEWGGLWERNKASAPASTARARWVHENLPVIEALSTVLDGETQDRDKLYDLILLYSEHTAAAGAGWPGNLTKDQTDESNATVVGWMQAAEQRTRQMLEDTLADTSGSFVKVFNPSLFDRNGIVEAAVPGDLWQGNEAGGMVLVDLITGCPVDCVMLMEPEDEVTVNPWNWTIGAQQHGAKVRFWAFDVPSFGWRTYQWRPVDPEDQSATVITATQKRVVEPEEIVVLQNNSYRLVYDMGIEHLVSLVDKDADHELVDPNAAYPPFSVLRSTHEDALSGRITEVLRPALEAAVVLQSPVDSVLRLSYGVGETIEQMELVLPRHGRYVEWQMTLNQDNMEYTPYSEHSSLYYAAFPLEIGGRDLESLQILVEGPETLVGNDDYLPGANRRSAVVRRTLGVSAEDYGVLISPRQAFAATLETPDYAGVDLPTESIVLFEMIRHFDEAGTKDLGPIKITQEPGKQRIEYQFRISSRQHGFSEEEVLQFGQDYLTPMIAVPSTSPGTVTGSFFAADGPVELVSLTRAKTLPGFGDNHDGHIIRLKNPTRRTLEVCFRVPWSQGTVQMTNRVGHSLESAREFKEGQISINFAPEETITLLIAAADTD